MPQDWGPAEIAKLKQLVEANGGVGSMDTMRRAGSGNAFPRIMFGNGGCPAARPARAASYPSSEGTRNYTVADVEKDSSFRDIVTAARKPYPPCFRNGARWESLDSRCAGG